MRRVLVLASLLALFSSGLACREITDEDLVGRFMFQRDFIRLELRLNSDHTFIETIADAGVVRTEAGTWKYSYGTRDLSFSDAWVPVIAPGSKRVQLRKTLSSLNAEPCGIRTVCLVVGDDDQLEFKKE
jgi:hypothetical protein